MYNYKYVHVCQICVQTYELCGKNLWFYFMFLLLKLLLRVLNDPYWKCGKH